MGAGPPAILLETPAKFSLAGTCRGLLFSSGLAQAYLLSPAASAGKPRRHSWPNCGSPPRGAAGLRQTPDGSSCERQQTERRRSLRPRCPPPPPASPQGRGIHPATPSRRPARDRSVSPAVVSAPPRSNLARALTPSARSAGLGFGSWKKLDPSFFRFSCICHRGDDVDARHRALAMGSVAIHSA